MLKFTPLILLCLTACLPAEMSVKEIKAREQFCARSGAKATTIFRHNKTNGVLSIRCVFDGYETPSEYLEEK